jgi:hypothetical protein
MVRIDLTIEVTTARDHIGAIPPSWRAIQPVDRRCGRASLPRMQDDNTPPAPGWLAEALTETEESAVNFFAWMDAEGISESDLCRHDRMDYVTAYDILWGAVYDIARSDPETAKALVDRNNQMIKAALEERQMEQARAKERRASRMEKLRERVRQARVPTLI